jgi:urease accessory protein
MLRYQKYAINLIPSTVPIMPTEIEASQLLLLLNWMSPAFPIGSFAYSHGLETAIIENEITKQNEVETWIADLMTQGSGWNDAVLFAQVWNSDSEDLNELALSMASSSERYLETTQLGRSFAIAASVFTDVKFVDGDLAYPIAAGMACKSMGVDKHSALLAFLQGFAAAQVSVAVRLVPLGQTAGLHILKNLMPIISETSNRAAAATLDDLGSCTLLADIAAMNHEHLQPRIFRT